jgi:hypothetical protein
VAYLRNKALPQLRYLKKAISPSGREFYIFQSNESWTYQYSSEPWTSFSAHEEFLCANAKDQNDWYWGGNRFLKDEEKGYGLVIADATLATMFMLSGLCHD